MSVKIRGSYKEPIELEMHPLEFIETMEVYILEDVCNRYPDDRLDFSKKKIRWPNGDVVSKEQKIIMKEWYSLKHKLLKSL